MDTSGLPMVPGYDLHEPIGHGGQGTVWAATRVSDGADVAVKIVAGDRPESPPDAYATLVSSDVIVRVQEVVALAHHQSAIVMERMRGGSLRGLVAARGLLTPGECVTVLAPLLEALGRLHALGIAHGDISPDNVLLDDSGRPRLIDLGASHARGDRERDVFGSDGFTAPEVAFGATPTPAADVYAVGALGWFALTGSDPGLGIPPVFDPASGPLHAALAESVHVDAADRPAADALAVEVFAAAPSEPLDLVRASDPSRGITRRIRSATEPAAEVGPRHASPRLSRLSSRGLAAKSRRGERGAISGRSSRLVASGLTLSLILLAATAWTALADRGARPAASASRTSSQPAPTAPSAPLAPTAPSAPLAPAPTTPGPPVPPPAGEAPSPPSGFAVLSAKRVEPGGWTALVQALADTRARAWSGGADAPAWAELTVPESPAAATDQEDRSALASAGEHAEGLSMTATSAELRSGSDVSGQVVIRSGISISAHVMVGSGGRFPQPSLAGEVLNLDLRWHEGRWRLWSVASPS